MQKLLFCLLITLITALTIQSAQAQYFPDTAWTRCYGGSGNDGGSYIQQTFDGGYIVIGESWSTDGDLQNAPIGLKTWVLKLDSTGNIEWQKYASPFYGFHNIKQTADSGYIYGGYEFTKLDANGNIVSQDSILSAIVLQTYDGGYAVAGHNQITKLSANNSVEWIASVGDAVITSLEQNKDSGFVAGDVIDEEMGLDTHELIKFDRYGSYEYRRIVSPGSTWDRTNTKPTLDDKLISVGRGVDYTNTFGYIRKGDSSTQWAMYITDTFPLDIIQNIDSGYIYCGNTSSNDAIISKCTPTGNNVTSVVLGGSNQDVLTVIINTRDSGYIAIGSSYSTDGDVWGNHGNSDLWIVKFKQDTSVHPPVINTTALNPKTSISQIKVYPTLSKGIINVEIPDGYEHAQLFLYDVTGRKVAFEEKGISTRRKILIDNPQTGQYILKVIADKEVQSFKITLLQ